MQLHTLQWFLALQPCLPHGTALSTFSCDPDDDLTGIQCGGPLSRHCLQEQELALCPVVDVLVSTPVLFPMAALKIARLSCTDGEPSASWPATSAQCLGQRCLQRAGKVSESAEAASCSFRFLAEVTRVSGVRCVQLDRRNFGAARRAPRD